MRGHILILLIACSIHEIDLHHTLWWQFPAQDFSSTLPAQSPALPSPPQPLNQSLSHFKFKNIAAPPGPLCWQQLSEAWPPLLPFFLPCLIENTSSSTQVFLSVPPTPKFLSRAGSFCYFSSHHLNLKNQVNTMNIAKIFWHLSHLILESRHCFISSLQLFQHPLNFSFSLFQPSNCFLQPYGMFECISCNAFLIWYSFTTLPLATNCKTTCWYLQAPTNFLLL